MEHDFREQKRTDFALGEMDPAERKYFANEFGNDADIAAIRNTRAVGDMLSDAFASEKSPGLSEIQRLAIETHIETLNEESEAAAAAQRAHRVRQRMAFWVPTSLAACALIASGITLIVLSVPGSLDPETVLPGDELVVENVPLNLRDVDPVPKPNPANDVLARYTQDRAAILAQEAPTYVGPSITSFMTGDDDGRHAFHPVRLNPVCSMPLKVDTRAFGFVRELIELGERPPREMVQVEAMLNSYEYEELRPAVESGPLSVYIEVSDCPWHSGHRLARVSVRAEDKPADEDGVVPIVAHDVRMAVEFNPLRVRAYRLIGYENRMPGVSGQAPAGTDVQAGHTVTMLYEIMPAGANQRATEYGFLDDELFRLRYQAPRRLTTAAMSDELFNVDLRYQAPDSVSETVVAAAGVDPGLRLAGASSDFKFAAAVAQFGMLLEDSPVKGSARYNQVRALALQGLGEDPLGERAKFIELVEKTEKVVAKRDG